MQDDPNLTVQITVPAAPTNPVPGVVIKVPDTGQGGPSLPRTGSDAALLVAVALIAILLGALLAHYGRRCVPSRRTT